MEFEQIIKEISALKPVSHMGDKIMEIACNPDSSLTDLVDVIQYDQSMTANLLKICNSPYFGLKSRISSVRQAVTFLGVEKVACLVTLGSSAQNFKKTQSGYDLDEGELWRYSVSSALIAQELAERLCPEKISLVFTAALLKDIGKIILSNYVQEAFNDIIEAVNQKGLSFVEAEQEIIGIDHAELGARVAEAWHFAPDMVNIIRHHHCPDQAADNDLSIPIVYLADSVCMMIGIGGGADGLSYRNNQDVLDRLDFTASDLEKIIVGFWEKLNGVEDLVKLSQGDE